MQSYPDYNKILQESTDQCDDGIEAVLSQELACEDRMIQLKSWTLQTFQITLANLEHD